MHSEPELSLAAVVAHDPDLKENAKHLFRQLDHVRTWTESVRAAPEADLSLDQLWLPDQADKLQARFELFFEYGQPVYMMPVLDRSYRYWWTCPGVGERGRSCSRGVSHSELLACVKVCLISSPLPSTPSVDPGPPRTRITVLLRLLLLQGASAPRLEARP
jgi:hypothetical protein